MQRTAVSTKILIGGFNSNNCIVLVGQRTTLEGYRHGVHVRRV